jgi:hypothetical protein
VREYTSEPVRGLPENLPEGEHILWQGGPKWTALAVRALHVRAVAIYFALLAVWFAGAAMMDGLPPSLPQPLQLASLQGLPQRSLCLGRSRFF